MEPDQLREHLAKMHAELAGANAVDPRSRELLGALMADIGRLLERPAAPTPGPQSEATSLPDRLERVAVDFEAEHPTLAAGSRRLVDLLGKAGL